MEYVYLALEFEPNYLQIRCAYTKKYNLANFLRNELEERTTLSHIVCFRIRGGSHVRIDPYEVIQVDPGEL